MRAGPRPIELNWAAAAAAMRAGPRPIELNWAAAAAMRAGPRPIELNWAAAALAAAALAAAWSPEARETLPGAREPRPAAVVRCPRFWLLFALHLAHDVGPGRVT